MNKRVAFALERLKEDIRELESLDASFWNKSLGVNHLKTLAKTIKNDADNLAESIRNI